MTAGLLTALPREEDRDLIDRIIGEQAGRPGALLSILEKLQEQHRHKYLSMETLEYVAARTGVPQSQVYGVATFFALFNLEPQGTHTVAICRGTACHTRGSRALLERVKLQLGLQETRRRGRQAHPDHARPAIHDPHGRLFRPVRPGPGRRGEPRHPGARQGAGAHPRGRAAAEGRRPMRIQDIAAFAAVREAGHRQAAPVEAAHRRRHGHLRLRQRRRVGLPRVRLRDRRARAQHPPGTGRVLRLLRRGAPRQRVGARPPAADAAPGPAEPRRRHPRRARPGAPAAARHHPLQGRGVGPSDRPRQVRLRLPRRPSLARAPVLRGPGQDGPAQLRPASTPTTSRSTSRSVGTRPSTRS